MKLTIYCCIVFLLSVLSANAQSAYSMHTLATGETLSMLAKTYHTTVGDIMRMNGMNAQSQLQTGEQIKIPADGTVVERATPPVTTPVAAAASIPKTHTVATGETLYRISQLYKIPVEQLKAINNLPDNNVKIGQTLLLSESVSTQKITPETTGVTPKQTVAQSQTKEVVQPPAPAKQNTSAGNTILEAQPQTDNTNETSAPVTTDNEMPQNNSPFNNTYASATTAPKEGFFINMYGKNNKRRDEQTKNGEAMTFKSASGWADKKYYILMNDAPAGSIVKIKNGKNELYAKVLWNLGDMKENNGLSFRISTATAAALGITDQKFDLRVSYYE